MLYFCVYQIINQIKRLGKRLKQRASIFKNGYLTEDYSSADRLSWQESHNHKNKASVPTIQESCQSSYHLE